ncbi:MAG: shikimate dehydrogenase [Campylobacterales bacterium]
MRLFGVVGNPVAHSRSPLLHNALFRYLGWSDRYVRFQLEHGQEIKEVCSRYKLSGVNVTVPFKEEAYALCDRVEGIAVDIGAVNTILCNNGELIGYNTDAPGFWASLGEDKPRRALLLGAGGTARALALMMRQEGVEVTVLNRSAKRLDYFRTIGVDAYDWDSFVVSRFDLVVNTTSAGLVDDELPLPQPLLTNVFDHVGRGYEVIYGKETPFMASLKARGIPVVDGASMLVWQAVLAQHLFTNPPLSNNEIAQLMFQAVIL